MFCFQPAFADCGDEQLANYYAGRGQPLVLLHGNGEGSSYWKGQIPELTRFFRGIAVDSRGHGSSESGKQGLSFDLMAHDLKTVLDTLGIQKAHILGFSDGGNLAIKFAMLFPDYVDKLILNGANVEMFAGMKPHFQLPVYAAYGALRVLGKVSPRAVRRRDVFGLMVHPYGVAMNELARLIMPTLISGGEHDIVRTSQTREMAERIPYCRVETFRDGDHFVAAKQPSRFNRTVVEFLLGR